MTDPLALALYSPQDVRQPAEVLEVIGREVVRLKRRLEALEAVRKVIAAGCKVADERKC